MLTVDTDPTEVGMDPVRLTRIDTHLVEHRDHILLTTLFGANIMRLQTFLNDLCYGQAGAQRTVGVLKHHLHARPDRLQLPVVQNIN